MQKKIEKKLNGGSGGHGNQLGEQLDQALGQQDPTAGAGGGDYGYGTGGDYGFGTGSDYGALAGGAGGSGGALSGAFSGGGGGGGGEYGFGDASAGYGPPSDAFGSGGGGFDAGNFEWEGAGDAAEGIWGEIGASIGEALGGA